MVGYETNELSSKKSLRSFGRSNEIGRICSEYLARERNFLNEDVKKQQRPRVAQFLLSFHRHGEKLRLMSLPSIHWSFENYLLEQQPERPYRFFGFEWTWGALELGRPYMPGQPTMGLVLPLPIGKLTGFLTTSITKDADPASHFVWAEIGSFLSLRNNERTKRINTVYKRNTAFWLDFTSPICSEVCRALPRLGSHANKEKDSVPVVITFLAARDQYDSDAARVVKVANLLNQNKWRSFKICDTWKYLHHDIPMLNVAGTLERRD